MSKSCKNLTPYVPGEQPRERKYLKLNTNESPFPPSPSVIEAAADAARNLNLYSDPECLSLREKMAARYGIGPENVVMGNGSDEILYFAFKAFADADRPLVFPDVTYGFYPVFADVNGIPYEEIPVGPDFEIDPDDYLVKGKTVVIANPNAPTGRFLPLCEIERIAAFDPERVVIIDEAYVDFGGESAVRLTKKYKNLFVTGTFSKSRSLAGGRLGFGIACKELIEDVNTVRFSFNPYNVNSMTAAAGAAALSDDGYYAKNCRMIMENREYTAEKLEKLGFRVIPSKTNFLFVESNAVDGLTLYRELKKRKILVRHFTSPRTANFNRITVGTLRQMEILLETVRKILEELK